MNPRLRDRGPGSEGDLLRCQEAIGYLFRREGLLRKSLTHSSVKDEKNPSNERLEFLGDAILGMVISEYLFSMLPENDEGDLTKVKSVVVSSQTLARLGAEMELDRFLMTGKGIRMKSEVPRSLLANAVEAIIAAVYLDRGMEAARHFVLDHLHPYVEEVLADDHETKNYKSLLQQTAQKDFSATPAYRVLSEVGPDHSKSFRVSAVLGNREFPPGRGASKKEAEQDAAKVALETIRSEKGRGNRRRRKSSSNGRSAPERGRGRDSRDRREERPAPPPEPKPEERSEPKAKKKKRGSRKKRSSSDASVETPARKEPAKDSRKREEPKGESRKSDKEKGEKGNGRRRRRRPRPESAKER